MSSIGWTPAGESPRTARALSPGLSQAALLAVVAAVIAASFLAPGTQSADAAALAGEDLTRLLRMMAALKAVMALAALAGVLWRLGTTIAMPRFAAYGVATAAMAAGPGVIWGMAHVGFGALLLHGGLATTVVLLWRDPAVSARLAELIAAKRQRLRAGARSPSQR